MPAEFPVKVQIRAIDRLSAVIDKVKSKFPELASKANQATAAFDKLDKSTKSWAGAAQRVGDGFTKVGKIMTVAFTLPAIAAGVYAVKAFADYETALVGVGKTSDIQGPELKALGLQFVEMSKRIGAPATELMALGQTAAQLGVHGSTNILKFSEVLAKLATATNIVGEEGATDLARFMKITGTDLQDVDRVGSALVALGNSSAATEAEILSFSTRLAGATALFGFSASQTLGYAAAMSSLGVEAEAGSSSVQRALGNINDAISKGGQKAAILAKITGIPLDQLKDKFKANAAGVLRDFAGGLGKVAERGGDVTQALKYFGMDGVRDIAVIGTLSKKTSELDRAMKTAADGVSENTALNKEFAAAMDTLNKRYDQVKAKVNALFIALGARLAPAANMVLDAFEGLINFLDSHPALATTLAVFVGILAILGPIFLAIGTLITGVVSMIATFTLANALLGVFGLTVWTATLPILIIIGKIILITALIVALVAAVVWISKKLWDWVGGWEGITGAVNATTNAIGNAIKAMLKFVGITPENMKGAMPGQMQFGANGAPVGMFGPQGAAVGGTDAKSKVNPEFSRQTNDARVSVEVRAPENTKVRSEANGDFFSLNRGMVGAF